MKIKIPNLAQTDPLVPANHQLLNLVVRIKERIATDIDAIVRVVHFPGWQGTTGGEREALAKQLAIEKAEKEKTLTEIYS